ncbi:MAG TPA: MarR family transcriptional regulator [Anaerolineae bacterium]|nr:MarR family transcriptional regulator [Anaerolineae bacterium]
MSQSPVFCNCLYFTANSLARIITKMADEEFRITGISPSYAFLLLLVDTNPGITPTALANELHLAPSTVSRMIDKLAQKGLLRRRAEGKNVGIYPTERGQELREIVNEAWHRLYERYSTILGEDFSRELTQKIDEATRKLEARG